MRIPSSMLALLCLAACGDAEPDPSADLGLASDGGLPLDAGLVPDGGPLDLGPPPDSGAEVDGGLGMDGGPAPDTGTVDAGMEPKTVGLITGACGELDDELSSPSPTTFVNHLDFGTEGFGTEDIPRLSGGAREILEEGTAGGSSEYSEAFAFEVLARCEAATLLWSETEVEYLPPDSKKTDFVAEIDGERIGVSVTRAVGFPRDAPYPTERAQALLTDKFADILSSSANVVDNQAWRKQILHVIAYEQRHADALLEAENSVPSEVRADTILWITVSDGEDAFLY